MIAVGAERVKLATARVLRGLTQGELAEQARVSPVTVINLEKGRVTKAHPATVFRISQALGMDAREIDEFKAALGLA